MKISLKQYLREARERKVAIGHFNISDLAALKAIFEAALQVSSALGGAAFQGKLPVIIGVSEGEREFIGVRQAAALIRSLREEYDYPIFINADHTYSLSAVEKAAAAGFDMIIFDGARLTLDENTKQTREAVKIVRSINSGILVEGEIGYIGSSSKVLDKMPEGVEISESALPAASLVKKFVEETGIDLVAPAVGNLHGMFRDAPNPSLKINLIGEIASSVRAPLVLHGGSGISNNDFIEAIKAGMSIIHINTELRVAWRKGIEGGLSQNPNETTPYKILPTAVAAVKEVVMEHLRLFNGL